MKISGVWVSKDFLRIFYCLGFRIQFVVVVVFLTFGCMLLKFICRFYNSTLSQRRPSVVSLN